MIKPEFFNKYLKALQAYIIRQLSNHLNGTVSMAVQGGSSEQRQLENLMQELFGSLSGFTFSFEERLILSLSLAPHLSPHYFNQIVQEFLPNGGEFPEFGGVRGNNHRGILPTGETIQFILAGNDVGKRWPIQEFFDPQHTFYRNDILWLESIREGEPMMSGRVILAPEWVTLLMTGDAIRPKFSADFPAKLATTRMNWDDLVLHPVTADQIADIKRWIEYHEVLETDPVLSRKINLGYRVLFHGPSGTGKTLTASLIGKEFNRDVYRVDLSQIVSKYIGETEKNLNKIFDRAEHKNWVMFLDEADAILGKRTGVSNSHDKHANQEVSFLLQRLEDFPGLMILATNFKSNIDDAFLRRFNSVVHFPLPNALERLTLWKKSMPGSVQHNGKLQLTQLAENYELSGASIMNVIQYGTLKALSREDKTLHQLDLVEGIRREMRKEEKTI